MVKLKSDKLAVLKYFSLSNLKKNTTELISATRARVHA